MWKDFKAFIARGNVIDLAVAVIIGGAFNQVVQSLVNDIIMPPIGLVVNRVNFKDLYINLSGQHYATLADAKAAGAPTINYGNFVNTLISFLIIAIVVFLLVRAISKLYRKPEAAAAAPTTKQCPYCFTAIPIKAHRCPNCTSQLEMDAGAQAAAEGAD